jgi:glutamyl-tRNA(Gln) amidotransferase subunit E
MGNRSDALDPRLREPLPRFGEWGEAAYLALGLRVGLEIHQQLATRRKLFCRCPAGLYSREHQAEILRHMRPTLSEMGEYDGTALMEFKTKKEIIYLLNNASVCTYEMDDAPPFELDPEAQDKATAIAMMLGCKIVGELHITRKQYLDGSIPTGFQRTTIVGVDGAIPYRGREIHIRQLGLEEDSCREVRDEGHVRTYRTDRLGMPLIETVTDPDMRTPHEAAEVGQILRRLARASGMVRTGTGAARQDVNVSIEGGTRIEIKGVPSLRAIPPLVHSEAIRQRSLLAIRDVLAARGVTADGIADRFVDITPQVRGTEYRIVQEAIAQGATVKAVPLPGFGGLLGAATQPRTTFLREFSDRIRVIACLDTLPNVACSTAGTETFASSEWDRIEKACGVDPETPVLVVWGSVRDVETACREIAIRAREACQGIPSETRQALDDGTNGFERILPGPDRMYPDTDLPPIMLDDERVEALRATLPDAPWRRVARLREAGVGDDLAVRLSRHGAYDLFWHLVDRLDGRGPAPAQLASLLLDRRCGRPASLAAAGPWWEETADRLARGELILEGVYATGGEPVAAVAQATARKLFDRLRADVETAGRDPGPAGQPQRGQWLMGRVMRDLRGKVPGRVVRRWVEEVLS